MENNIKCKVFKPKFIPVTWKIMVHDSSTGEEYGFNYTGDIATKSKTKISKEFICFMNRYLTGMGIKKHDFFLGIYSDKLSEDNCAMDFREYIKGNPNTFGIRYMPKMS